MIEILRPGPLTTVQDLGRAGYSHLGVPEAGAADAFSLRIANRLVGNLDDAAALEMTGEGSSLRFETDGFVALTGGRLEATLDDAPVPMYQTLAVKAGTVLECGRITFGWRSYLAVAGGIRTAAVLGSVSTDTLAGLGGVPLAAGQHLETGAHAGAPAFYMRHPPYYPQATVLRVQAGPQQDWFSADARRLFATSAFRVLSRSDRTGARLEGPVLAHDRDMELPSMGVTMGAVQVPPSGQPIVLLANHGATGGYPLIANVISADIGAMAQLAPGAELRFSEVNRETALELLREQETRLDTSLLGADPALLAARALMVLAGQHTSLKQAAVADGVRRIRIRRGD
ncbi:MAG TPA: biotin-dependent carboxyltransferase family protein [Gammaproteobacteria bacterium]|nr:biotin-dependent carboxyltransferase family protein [Gammaproteobacteria bacterium]